MIASLDDRNRALQELFERGMELAPAAREAAFVECCADAALRAEALELLALSDRDPSFLTRPLRAGETTWQQLFHDLPAAMPERVGTYTLLRQLGAGGMGRVFLAEQQSPRREVAVKLLFGRVTGEATDGNGGTQPAQSDAGRRFRREIEALARLQHPGLARILEAGVDAEGRAWFAMHRVDGKPLMDAAAERRLTVRARLLLLAQVCDAVDYAHRQGVVHRDLKPGNVLLDKDGQPVVLDFGIARVASPGGPLTLQTSLPQLVGTLAYMSPEQAACDGSGLDGRTDVYALGVMLHELLTGRMPYVTRGLDPAEAVEVVRTAEPAPLGELTPGVEVDAGAADASGARSESDRPRESGASDAGQHVVVDLRELQLVVNTALAKRAEDRYSSAAALADDLRRCAEGRPILARRPSAAQRVRLLWRRQPVTCSAVLLAALVLLGGVLVAAVQLETAHGNEAAAKDELEQRMRLSDRLALRDVQEQLGELWPVRPEIEADLQRVADRLIEMRARLPAHRARWAELETLLPGSRAHQGSHPASSVREALAAEEWEAGLLAELVPALEAAFAPGGHFGLLANVEWRLEYARTVHDVTVSGAAEAWSQASEAVARDPRFGGMRLPPQPGLIPLGPDPRSGLEEFSLWFWTGETPRRDSLTRELLLDENSGVVLVLVPGGLALMGSQSADRNARRYVKTAGSNEGPLVEVELAPHFIMKDELTQGQWLRFTGFNPSLPRSPDIDEAVSLLRLPVNNITWVQADRFARQIGCMLPTEMQWEHAARADTDTPWWPGTDWELLESAVNVADRTGLPPENWPHDAAGRVFDDGYPNLAPTDWGAVNPFGLRNVHGNVWEFCADRYRSSLLGEFLAGTGLHLVEPTPGDPELYVLRGGSFEESLNVARSSFRSDVVATRRTSASIRAVRAIESAGSDG